MIAWLINWLKSSGPSWGYKRIWLDALVITTCLVAVTWAICLWLGFTTFATFQEDGPIEDTQSLTLVTTALVSAVAAFRNRILGRFVAIFTACISVIFFMREMPICRPGMTDFCVTKTALPLVIATVGVILLGAAVLFEYRRRGGLLQAIHPRLSWPLAITASLLVLGQIAEKLDIVALEESFELAGYVTLFLSSVWLLRLGSRKAAGQSRSGGTLPLRRR